MAAITKASFVSSINTMRVAPAGRVPTVSGIATNSDPALTYIQVAAANGVTVVNPSDTEPDAVTTDLDGTGSPIELAPVGDDIRDLMIQKATEWSRVRQIRFRLTGTTSPAGLLTTRNAYIVTPDPASSVPTSGDAIYDILASGEEISQSALNALIANLTVTINADIQTLEYSDLTYCHSNCHSSCHSSRGRR